MSDNLTNQGAAKLLIEKAIRELPLLPDMESKISDLLADFLMMCGLSRANDLPRARQCSSIAARKELKKLESLSAQLYEHIYQLHRTSLESLEVAKFPHPFAIADDLLPMIKHAKSGIERLSTKSARPKQHSKPAAKNITAHTFRIYKKLTGKEPTRTVVDGKAKGEFLDFLQAIFAALNMKVSAEAQMKAHGEN